MTAPFKQTTWRIRNGVRKILAGLTPFGESVWPGAHTDLFVAHASIYLFFSRFVQQATVLDAGCGTGFGAATLSAAGAASVLGVDVDARSVRYARRNFGSDEVRFEVGNLERLVLPKGEFNLIVSSNALEHLANPGQFLADCQGFLRPGGRLIVAVPPIVSEADRQVHGHIHYHRSNLTVTQWAALFRETGWSVLPYFHRLCPGLPGIDFGSHQPSGLRPEDFVFDSCSLEELQRQPSITALFVLNSGGCQAT